MRPVLLLVTLLLAIAGTAAAEGLPGVGKAWCGDSPEREQFQRAHPQCQAESPFLQQIDEIQSCKACWTGRDHCTAECEKTATLGEQEHCMAQCNMQWRCTPGFDCR